MSKITTQEATPDFVVRHVAAIAAANGDLEVLMNLCRKGHTDIVRQAVKEALK